MKRENTPKEQRQQRFRTIVDGKKQNLQLDAILTGLDAMTGSLMCHH